MSFAKQSKKKSKSSQKIKMDKPKSYKIDHSKIDSKVSDNNKDLDISKIEKEVLDLPVYCTSPDKSREMDLFLVHVMIQAQRGTITPYFIGNYSSKSYDMQIKSSSLNLSPKDLMKDNSEDVINLKRK